MENEVAIIETRATQLAEKIENLVTEARKKVASVANTAQVYTYYEIGRYIVEDEQGGKAKATFILPWTHYQIIMREENPQARRFYEQEAYNQQWSKRQLQRQVGSSLYEDADVCQLF